MKKENQQKKPLNASEKTSQQNTLKRTSQQKNSNGLQKQSADKRNRANKAENWLEGEKAERLKEWCANGLSEAQIAHNMGISRATLFNWKTECEELAAAIADYKTVADAEVVGTLFRRCKGYHYTEQKRRLNPEGVMEVYEEVDKYLPPDIKAIQFWLENRMPSEWKDKVEEEQPNQGINFITFGSKEDEEHFNEWSQ